MAKTIVDFIGPEGSSISNFNSKIDPSLQNNPLGMSIDEINRQILIAKDIENQRGLKPEEAQRLSELIAVAESRQDKKSEIQQKQILDLFGGAGGGGGGSGVGGGGSGGVDTTAIPIFDQAAYQNDLNQSAQTQRDAINNIFGSQRQSGLQSLNDIFGQQRGQAIDEAAVLGNLRQPTFQASTLANIDAQKGKQTQEFLSQLLGQQGQAQSGLEQNLAQQLGQGRQFGANLANNQNQFSRSLTNNKNQFDQSLALDRTKSLAGLLQGNSQFGQTFGLSQNQFNADQRQRSLENLFNQQALDQSEQLGRLQANAQKKSALEQFSSVAGGLGGLFGGIGGLAKGLKA